MTTFEGLILLAAFAAVVIIAVGVDVIAKKLKEIIDKQYANWEQLRKIETHEDVSTSAIIELKDVVDKMHRNLCVEIADKMVDKVYPPTYVTPCYAPNGICMNPHGDCINCPKRGTGGTWSTSTNTIKEE